MLQTIVYIFFQNVGVFKFKLKKKNKTLTQMQTGS